MVKNHPLGIPLQPYSLSCLSLLEPFNEQFIASPMISTVWIICLPKTDKARYEVFRPCAKASGWMSVRVFNRKIGVQNSEMTQAISFRVKTIYFVSHSSFLVLSNSVSQSSLSISDLISCTTNLATFVPFVKYLRP